MRLFHLAQICCLPPHLSMWPLTGWRRDHAHTVGPYRIPLIKMINISISHKNAYMCYNDARCYFHVPGIRISSIVFSRNILFRPLLDLFVIVCSLGGVWCQLVPWGCVVQSCISPHWGHPLGTSPNAIGSKGLQALGQALRLDTDYSSDWQLALKGSLSGI